MSSPDKQHAFIAQQTRLALLEAAVLAQFRAALEDGFDGLVIDASVCKGQTVISIDYMRGGMSHAGESL